MQTGSYVNGKWFHPKSNRLVRNLNPADPDDVIAEFPAATPKTCKTPSPPRKLRLEIWKKTPGRSAAACLARRRYRAPTRR